MLPAYLSRLVLILLSFHGQEVLALATASDHVDLSKCVSGMRKIGEMLNTKTMDQLKFDDSNGSRRFSFSGASLPSYYKSNDSSVEAFCRSTVRTIHHYHGGCLVGKVVNGNFRVEGIDSLRVVDGSTFTTTPGTNPQATVMMLGRYVGLKMLWERREGKLDSTLYQHGVGE